MIKEHTLLPIIYSLKEELHFRFSKKHVALPGPKTSAGELLIVNTSSIEEFHHTRARQKCPIHSSSLT
jgi:hypothetical protein